MAADTKIPVKQQKSMRADCDSPWKHALALYFRDFMEFCLPHIAAEIDWSKGFELLDKELNAITRDAEIGKRIADKLIKVQKRDGKETFILCHLEVDGKPKEELPRRMMVYRFRIYDLYRLPIISVAILIDNDPNWRVDHHQEECFGTHLQIRYLIVKLLDYQKRRQELEALNNRFAIVMLAQLVVLETKNNPKARLYGKTILTRLLYETGFTKQDISQLFIFVDWVVPLPEELMVKYHQMLKQLEEERKVEFITTPQRVGRMEGRKEGEVTMFTRLLQRRFTHIPTSYLARIEQADSHTLLIWAERVLDAASLEDIFD